MDVQTLFSVRGKVALVTGGSRGIGEMIAAGFLANGAKVYISSRKAAACDATAQRLSDTYGGEWEAKPEPTPPVAPPLGKLPPAAGAAFAQADPAFPDQAAIDAIGAPDWAALTAPMFQPIFVALEQGIAPEELVAHMAEWYPRMDDAQLTELLARALFVAEVWGRVNAGRP